MVSSSCSTTRTVLPRLRRCSSEPKRRGKTGGARARDFPGEGRGGETLAGADGEQRGGHVLRHPLGVVIEISPPKFSRENFQDAGEANPFFVFFFLPRRFAPIRSSV